MAQLQKLRLSAPANTSASGLSFVYQDTSDRGFYNLFFPRADFIELKPKMYRVENLEEINKSMQRVKLHDVVADVRI